MSHSPAETVVAFTSTMTTDAIEQDAGFATITIFRPNVKAVVGNGFTLVSADGDVFIGTIVGADRGEYVLDFS
jgi:hypothetical protein